MSGVFSDLANYIANKICSITVCCDLYSDWVNDWVREVDRYRGLLLAQCNFEFGIYWSKITESFVCIILLIMNIAIFFAPLSTAWIFICDGKCNFSNMKMPVYLFCVNIWVHINYVIVKCLSASQVSTVEILSSQRCCRHRHRQPTALLCPTTVYILESGAPECSRTGISSIPSPHSFALASAVARSVSVFSASPTSKWILFEFHRTWSASKWVEWLF